MTFTLIEANPVRYGNLRQSLIREIQTSKTYLNLVQYVLPCLFTLSRKVSLCCAKTGLCGLNPHLGMAGILFPFDRRRRQSAAGS